MTSQRGKVVAWEVRVEGFMKRKKIKYVGGYWSLKKYGN